jgi:glycosyltransferase involved in cell wall biosynthesis
MKKLVSILIPAYNAAEFIADTIKSVLAQTWPRKEIIVVDDGSQDDTLAIACQFESKQVLVVTKDNEGAAATRNKAFSLCQGDYIQWLDADDLLSPNKISRQMALVEGGCGSRCLLSSSWAYFMYRLQRARFMPTALWCDLSPTEWLVRKLSQNLYMQTATWLVSREVSEAAGPWNPRLLVDDDGEYFCRVLLQSEGVRFVSDAKVFYRVSGYSRLSYIGRSGRKMAAQFDSMRLHIGYLLSLEDSARTRAACVKYLQNSLLTFYPERMDIVREAEGLAAELGGELVAPRLPSKYEWVRRLCGWQCGKLAMVYLPRARWSLMRRCEYLLSLQSGRGSETL